MEHSWENVKTKVTVLAQWLRMEYFNLMSHYETNGRLDNVEFTSYGT